MKWPRRGFEPSIDAIGFSCVVRLPLCVSCSLHPTTCYPEMSSLFQLCSIANALQSAPFFLFFLVYMIQSFIFLSQSQTRGSHASHFLFFPLSLLRAGERSQLLMLLPFSVSVQSNPTPFVYLCCTPSNRFLLVFRARRALLPFSAPLLPTTHHAQFQSES